MNKLKTVLSIVGNYFFFIINFFFAGVCFAGLFKNSDILLNILMMILPLACAIINLIIGVKKIMGHPIVGALKIINFILCFFITIPVLWGDYLFIVLWLISGEPMFSF